MAIIAQPVIGQTTTTGTQTSGVVFIQLKDSVTNQPTNGNNITIFYDVNLGGTITHNQVTIPGQSAQIYFGILSDTSTGFFASFTVTGQSNTPPPAPPVGTCDLKILNIINSNESFIGANDAQITVNASSSYGPILYSLDDVTFQSSNVFTGQSGGVKTIYVKDANPVGCSVENTITIQTTANLLISNPGVALAGGNTSRWNAAFNPIVFQYQRKDYEVTGATLYSVSQPLITITGTTFAVNGDLTILVNLVAANKAAGINAVDLYVYINTVAYNGAFKILDATISSVSVATVFTTSTASGFMNSDNMKPYYKIYTKISYNDPITGQPSSIISKNSANGTGLIKADYKNFLQSLLQIKDDSGYNLVNFRDSNLSASYQIAYAEHWEDGTVNPDGSTGHTSNFIPLANTFYVVFAAKQLGDQYGGNLANYVPFKNLPANWITDFKEPVYSLSYPFDISFIYGEDLAGLQLYYKITLLDINRNVIGDGTSITAFLLNEDGSFLLNEDGSKFIIGNQSFFNTPIVEHVGLNRLLIDNNFDPEVYYFKIGIFYDTVSGGTTTTTQVMNDQVVRVDKNCDYNSVYLRWIGINGSWNYYRFIFNQEHTLDVQNAQIITRYVQDWENEQSIEDVISKSASEKIQVHAVDMTVDEIKGCQAIKFSPKVQICVQQSPPKWQTVVVNSATYAEYETQLSAYEFAVTFNMPSKNVQTQ